MLNQTSPGLRSEVLNIRLARKTTHHQQLLELLKTSMGELPFQSRETFLNRPVLLHPEFIPVMERLCSVLDQAIRQIVAHYFEDERIRAIYQLDSELEDILRPLNSLPFEPGLYRPDLLFQTDGSVRICEIGCRYPTNGWLLSYYLNKAQTLQIKEIPENWQEIKALHNFIEDFAAHWDIEKPLFLVHEKEKGTEVFYLLKDLEEMGYQWHSVKPGDVQLADGDLVAGGLPASQFILEMDREELRSFDLKVLETMARKGQCLNDPRSLILLHDKRVLAVLYNREIMAQYLPAEAYEFLRQFLIPSWSVSHPGIREKLLRTSGNYVLKRNSGGRGLDMYVRNECSPETWQEKIEEEGENFMVQEFVEQYQFELEQDGEIRLVNIVGMLLCQNAKSFGPGIFRGSSERIINVHQGRGVILPALTETPVLP